MNAPSRRPVEAPLAQPGEPPSQRRRVLVFSSRGGGGHSSGFAALQGHLGSTHDVIRADVLQEALAPLDPLRWLSSGKLGGEDFYNLCLRRGWHGLATELCDLLGAPAMLAKAQRIEELILPYVRAHAPHVLVSMIPLLNQSFLRVARVLGVPLLVLPVDLDTSNYVNGLYAPDDPSFRYLLSFEDEALRPSMRAAAIPEALVRVVGFPVRPAFLTPKPGASLRAELGLPTEGPIVMLLMGAAGAASLLDYADELRALRGPAHLVFCAGRNARLAARLGEARFQRGVTHSVVGYTERIADYMAVAELLITKPGPGTISEALYMNLPMLLDQTTPLLRWEELNVGLVLRNGFGAALSELDDVGPLVEKYLGDGDHLRHARRQLAAYPKRHFEREFRSVLAELI